MTSHFDAAVIGGGPAGCSAAITLAKYGHKVVVLESESFPRHRPGETLHPGAEPLFEKLGVVDAVNQAGFHRHRGQSIRWSGGNRFEPFGSDERGDWLGFQATRADLDRILLDHARRCSAEIRQPFRVKSVDWSNPVCIRAEDSVLTADWVLDASGRHQFVSRSQSIDWIHHSHRLIARYGYVTPNRMELGDPQISQDDNGWTWVAPITHDRLAWVRLRFDGADVGADWLPADLTGCNSIGHSCGADVTWRIAQQTVGESWYLLGDAACILDPASSHGVLRAMMTGMRAAEGIHGCLRGKVSRESEIANYHAWLSDWFYKDIQRLQELYPDKFLSPKRVAPVE